MSDFFNSLLKEAPWLKPVLGWSLAFVIVFLILMIPAYFIFWPFLARVRTQLAAFIERLAERLKGGRRERAERLNSAAGEFLTDGGLWRLNSEAQGH